MENTKKTVFQKNSETSLVYWHNDFYIEVTFLNSKHAMVFYKQYNVGSKAVVYPLTDANFQTMLSLMENEQYDCKAMPSIEDYKELQEEYSDALSFYQ